MQPQRWLRRHAAPRDRLASRAFDCHDAGSAGQSGSVEQQLHDAWVANEYSARIANVRPLSASLLRTPPDAARGTARDAVWMAETTIESSRSCNRSATEYPKGHETKPFGRHRENLNSTYISYACCLFLIRATRIFGLEVPTATCYGTLVGGSAPGGGRSLTPRPHPLMAPRGCVSSSRRRWEGQGLNSRWSPRRNHRRARMPPRRWAPPGDMPDTASLRFLAWRPAALDCF